MNILKANIGMIFCSLLAIITLSQSAYAGGECASLGGACDDGGWDPTAKLEEIGNPNAGQEQISAKWPEKSREMRWNMSSKSQDTQAREVIEDNEEKQKPEMSAKQSTNSLHEVMIEIDEITNSDILLDVSESAKEHISGSLAIPYHEFMQGDSLKSVQEIAKILGDAGISQDDSLVLYGECLPCGGGPSASAYVYWMMKSLGHEKVRILNGYVQDWKDIGLPVSSSATVRPAAKYTPQFTDRFIGNYDYVKSGRPQVVDSRTIQEYGLGSIPGAISIPYESVLDGDKMRNVNELEKCFSILNKEQPVVVFTNTGFKGSVVWLALEIMGYDAKLYSYQDWMANQLNEQESSDIKG